MISCNLQLLSRSPQMISVLGQRRVELLIKPHTINVSPLLYIVIKVPRHVKKSDFIFGGGVWLIFFIQRRNNHNFFYLHWLIYKIKTSYLPTIWKDISFWKKCKTDYSVKSFFLTEKYKFWAKLFHGILTYGRLHVKPIKTVIFHCGKMWVPIYLDISIDAWQSFWRDMT